LQAFSKRFARGYRPEMSIGIIDSIFLHEKTRQDECLRSAGCRSKLMHR
jgi:hypothetical protein